jgi:hypothetical protein
MRMKTTLVALTAFAQLGCASSDPAPETAAASVDVQVAALGVPGVVYDVRLFEQSPGDARSFVAVATHLNQSPTAADGTFSANYPCKSLPNGGVGRVDVIAHVPTIDGAIADLVARDFGEIGEGTEGLGGQLTFARKSQMFHCTAGKATPITFALAVSPRQDLAPDGSNIRLAYQAQTLELAVVPGQARTAATQVSVTATTSATLPQIYAFGFDTAMLTKLAVTDSVTPKPTRTLRADWQLPAVGAKYDNASFALLFGSQPGTQLVMGDSMYIWSMSQAKDATKDRMLVDSFRVVVAGKVADGAKTNAGMLINCQTANVMNYTGTGINLVYTKDVDPSRLNLVEQQYFIHLANGKPVASQAIGALDRGNGEFALIMHEVATPSIVFAAKCGFARPDPKGGLRASCDETAAGSGILVEYSLADIAASK